MNDSKIKDKNETMEFAVAVVLMLYCNGVYYMSDKFYDTALFFVKEKEAVYYLLSDLIDDLLDDFEYYKNTYGKGHEKEEEINVLELKEKVMVLHEQSVKDLIMKNLDDNLKVRVGG
ncbi:hypothetical protein HV097_00030 [Enterobacter roggenkampii]|uniref:hypothetical protein n=1 Tax=Enterobacter roggenkampii TaxID=1812935 RepID=UPI0015EABBFE|nr:hypothetical protein [Enterobacter roggenkampii]QMR79267.1 hypothetical protein HV097_00030 [Enterobacter roggenkampii]